MTAADTMFDRAAPQAHDVVPLADLHAAGLPSVERGTATLTAARGVALLADGRPAEALAVLRQAVAAGDATPVTLLNLALAEDQAGDRAVARRQMQEIAGLLPGWDEPKLRLAQALRADGDMTAAALAYEAVLAINPRREEALVSLGVLRLGGGDAPGAMVVLLRCCGIAPNNAEAWDALGLAALQTGDAAAALEAFAEAQGLAPRWLEPALHMIDAACVAGTVEAELARLQRAAVTDPLDPVGATARGVLLERMGRHDAAIDALEVAVTLAPEAARPTILLASALARTTRLDEADKWLRRAIELDPAEPRLHNDLGAVLMRKHHHAEARAELAALIETHGEQVGALCNLATATVCCGLQADAVSIAERAIALAPEAGLPRRALVNALPYLDGVTGSELLAALVACSDRATRGVPPVFVNLADPDRRLRLGVLSGSLRTHPVGWMTIAGFEALDPASFELVVLAQHAAHDAIARRFRAIARGWYDVDSTDDAGIAALGRSLGIDVLIDLGGYGDAGRVLACAHRIAPVQIKWVGMQNHSSGLAEMDWFITDRWETPPGFERLYSERLLHLPDGYICYSPPPYAPEVAKLPALANGYVTFGCFNNLAKITPRAIATWAGILRAMPDARLVLKTHQFSDHEAAAHMHAAFAAHGIAAARVELRGASRHRAFLGEYNQIDIVLDPFPYSGGLTTCEALWMGVPTVTLPGEIFASRHSASHLSNVGLSDWVADDLAGYVAIALARAADLPALAALRAGLRARVKASPLCDAPRFGRNLGAALRRTWRDWCASRA
jgi:predicted O-linked N-acetylglucosamine transferase (SPINDLY family)